jgi:D-serine dehydratase
MNGLIGLDLMLNVDNSDELNINEISEHIDRLIGTCMLNIYTLQDIEWYDLLNELVAMLGILREKSGVNIRVRKNESKYNITKSQIEDYVKSIQKEDDDDDEISKEDI